MSEVKEKKRNQLKLIFNKFVIIILINACTKYLPVIK